MPTKKAPTTSLNQKLSVLASLKGLSQAEIARRVGVPPSHLNHYLKGHGDVRSELFLEILRELGIDIAALVNKELAGLQGLELKEDATPGEAIESLLRSMEPTPRKALVGYVSKVVLTNLGTKVRPQVRILRSLV